MLAIFYIVTTLLSGHTLARGLQKQSAVVQTALGDLDIPVRSVLCFIDSEWGFFLKPFQVDGM